MGLVNEAPLTWLNISHYIFVLRYYDRPSTFSGQRALNFVLDNQNLIDKTLLINIRLIRVDKNKGV
jgi:hypothetical protein